MKKLLASLLVLTASGCPDIQVDEGEINAAGPTVEFDPARSQATGARYLPFPNDLVRDPRTGKIALSAQACESPATTATRTNVLNKLDGFGTYEVGLQISLSAAVDPATLAGRVVLYKMTNQTASFAQPVPTTVRASTTLRFSNENCASPETVNTVVIIPLVPLDDNSTYVYALRSGIASADGSPFEPSLTWSLVSSDVAPVTLDASGAVVADRTPLDPEDPADNASLVALAGLYRAHQRPLNFLEEAGIPRSEVLVAAAFTTQTVVDPFDSAVVGSPANMLPTNDFLTDPVGPLSGAAGFGPTAATFCSGGDTPAECFLKLALGGCSPATTGCTAANYAVGAGACAGIYDCSFVGGIYAGVIQNDNYQTQLENNGSSIKLQGPWTDPAKPTRTGYLNLSTYVSVPTGSMPAGGWPVVIFGHAIGSSRENLFAVAGKNARAGFATVAIDFVAHGSRAVRTSYSLAAGCRGKCYLGAVEQTKECSTAADCGGTQTCGSTDPSVTAPRNPPTVLTAPQCFAPLFSADLSNTRDNVRQSILDVIRVGKALKACGTTNCGPLQVNPTRIFYGGVSLGSIIGASAAAMSPDIRTAALSTGAAGWLDIIENTSSLPIRCGLVNNLIDAGVLTGAKWAGGTTGLCLEDGGNAWKMQPGYATFAAIGRWVLDPADPANFAFRLRNKKVLVQKVVDDGVFPNIATDRLAALAGILNPVNASPFAGGVAESTQLAGRRASIQVNYTTGASAAYDHSSLLKPAASNPTLGAAGTLRMLTDFAQYLDNNDDSNL